MINADDANADYFAAFEADQVVTYGIDSEKAQYRAVDIEYRPGGTHFAISPEDGRWEMGLVGDFNVYNAAAAIAVARNQGMLIEQIQRRLNQITAISGRKIGRASCRERVES